MSAPPPAEQPDAKPKLHEDETTAEQPAVPDHPEVNVEAEVGRFSPQREAIVTLCPTTFSQSSQNPDDSETFSDYDSTASSTASVNSSLFSYTYENGRRYHSYKESGSGYLLPNDSTEAERLDLTHHLFCLTLDGDLCLTKLDNPERILDVGSECDVKFRTLLLRGPLLTSTFP